MLLFCFLAPEIVNYEPLGLEADMWYVLILFFCHLDYMLLCCALKNEMINFFSSLPPPLLCRSIGVITYIL